MFIRAGAHLSEHLFYCQKEGVLKEFAEIMNAGGFDAVVDRDADERENG
jgi:hypothetical protein